MITGIYQIINKSNGRRYIGSATNIPDRWSYHRHHLRYGTHDNKHLQRAWTKYGEAVFCFGVICYCSIADLQKMEEQYLTLVPSKHYYNMSKTAYVPMLGRSHSIKTKKQMSKKKLGRILSEVTRQRMSLAHIGKSSPSKGYKWTKAQKEKLKHRTPGFEGKRHTVTSRRKIQQAHATKLSVDAVIAIKQRLIAGEHPKTIAPDFNVSAHYIHKIRRGDKWKTLV